MKYGAVRKFSQVIFWKRSTIWREFNRSEVAFKNTLTDQACRNIFRAVSELTTVDNCVNDCESITSSNHEQTPSACVQTGRHRAISQLKHATIRDREPSRLSRRTVKRIVRYLRCRKLGRKNRKIMKQSAPASSVLHKI